MPTPGHTILVVCLFALAGCYSFRGTSIPAEAQTFYVTLFEDLSGGPPTLSTTFSEALKDKIRSESRLIYADTDPDVSFSGTIQRFDVSYVAPKDDQTSAFNRLTISINTKFESNYDSNQNWTKSFSFFKDFGRDQDLLSIQDQLIEEIFEQIIEDIFRAAFANW